MDIQRKKRRKNKSVSYSDLRSRLEEYSAFKEKKWRDDDYFDDEIGCTFDRFPFYILKDMHKYMLFKITLALLAVLIVFLCTFIKAPYTEYILRKIQYVTTWEMDFVEIGQKVAPVIRSLWEGNLESGLERVVMAPERSIYPQNEPHFIAPLEGELEKTFGLNFNALRQQEEMFYGVVFAAPRGSLVRATADGLVQEIREDPAFGLCLLLKHHPGGVESFYGYLEETLVKEGEEVKQGQKIARVGFAPGEKLPSLYFEIRKNGEPVDPLPLLLGGEG